MARHTKVYNGLISFYIDSIKDLEKDLLSAYENACLLPTENHEERLKVLRGSLSSELEAIIDLSRDQAVHFEKIEMIKEWEKSSLIESTAENALKAIRRLKGKGAISTHRKLDMDHIMNDVNE